MKRFLKSLILLPVAVLVILLAVANRAPVTLSLDPFSKGAPEISFSLPLYALLFGAAMLGVVLGGSGAWPAQAKHRRAERRFKREARSLRTEIERLRTEAGVPAGLPGLPALAAPKAVRA